MINIKELIEDVIRDLGNNMPLDTVSSKVQVISRLLKNDVFTQWVDNEFAKGYPKNSEVPHYRKFFIVGVKASYVAYGLGGALHYSNQQVPIENLGIDRYRQIAEITVKDTISIIQQAIKPGSDIYISIPPYETGLIQEILAGCQIINMYKVISNQSYQNIINQIKTKLLDIFLEFNGQLFDNEIDFNVMSKKEDIERIVNQTINTAVYVEGNAKISDSNLVGGTTNSVQINITEKKALLDIVKKIEKLSQEVDEDRTDIAEAILDIRTELDNKINNPKILKTAFNAIKGVVGVSEIYDLAQKGIELLQQNV